MSDSPTLFGTYDTQYDGVKIAFEEGFTSGREVGAAVSVWREGRCVVDLWSGHTDRKKSLPWQEDTLCCFFSVSKALTATCLLQAVDQGLINLDAEVTEYWPEFGAKSAYKTTVRHLLTHQAGLPGLHEPVTRETLYDWNSMCKRLAAETPWWPPGTEHGYHARSFGFLVGEVLRRATGHNVGAWLAKNISSKLDLDVYIGLSEVDQKRCVAMIPARLRPGEVNNLTPAMRKMIRDFIDKSTATGAAFQNPTLGVGYMNTAEFRAAQLPAMNGHGTARDVAKFMQNIPHILSANLITQAVATASYGEDRVLKSTSRFGLGYMLHDEEAPVGWPGCFGHAGAGGSLAFADTHKKIGFAFVMNQMQAGVVTGGTTATACAAALKLCVD